ncbi:MAG: hypothetical protein H6713_42825 [Myxococcales bacterium]|nr:hypothetical protein [Myxococcales bacterium]
MRANDTRAGWASRWWARLIGVLVTIAIVLPASAGRACPMKQAKSCCCCKHDGAEAPAAPAVKRVPCCASDMSWASSSVAVVEEVKPPPVAALAPGDWFGTSVAPPRLRALIAQPRARGPPGRAPRYKQFCSYLL